MKPLCCAHQDFTSALFVKEQLPQWLLFLVSKPFRKERIPQSSGGEENEGSDSVGGDDAMETARGSVGNAKKRALRSSTYEISPGNEKNICEYLTSFPLLRTPGGGCSGLCKVHSLGCVPRKWLQSCNSPLVWLSAVPALPWALTALGFNSDFSWGPSQTPSAGIRFPC